MCKTAQFLSSIVPNASVASDYVTPFTLPMVIFNGIFLNNDNTPRMFLWMWMKYLSWFSYSNEALVINQWHGISNITCDTDISLCFLEGSQIIDYLNIKEVTNDQHQ